MYVHVKVLEGRGSLVNLGAHAEDKLVIRVGEPKSTKGAADMPSSILDAPILHTPTGISIPDKLSNKIKHQITKNAVHRDMDKFQLRLYVLKHDGTEVKWLGIVGFRLLYLTGGYVVERWVPMKPATVTEPGELRVRVVVRENEADVIAVLSQPTALVHSKPTEGCCCDVCDPQFKLTNPIIAYFDFDEKHLVSNKNSTLDDGRLLSDVDISPYHTKTENDTTISTMSYRSRREAPALTRFVTPSLPCCERRKALHLLPPSHLLTAS